MQQIKKSFDLPRDAMSFVPFLMLPMVVGAMILLVLPSSEGGVIAIVFATVALAWYLLGGAIAVTHLLRGLSTRRDLSRISAAVQATREPVWISDAEGQILLQNEGATQAFGDHNGESIVALVGRWRADAENAFQWMAKRAMRGRNCDIDLPDGQVLSVSQLGRGDLLVWSQIPNATAMAEANLLTAAAEKAAAVLATELAQDQTDFEHLPVAMILVGVDGYVRIANAAARELIDGLEDNPHLGSLLEGPGRAIGDWIGDVLDERSDGHAEILRLRRDGAEQYFQVALKPDRNDPTGLIAVLTDANALKTLEAQFAQSQKMQAIGQLAGGIAHDFNNLLTAITGHCDLLMLRCDKADADYADLDQISQNANRAAALVSQLLAFSRKQTLKLEWLDLRDTMADLTHLLNRLVGERVALRIQNEAGLLPIRADKRQLEQVIMNLVVNARDAMPSGGDITIRTRNLHLAQSEVSGRVTIPKGDFVQVDICDEGTGIAPDVIDKIFEPFFTTKRLGEGTGLGLSTAYGIVKQTGGYIFCDSAAGTGTTFTLIFPSSRTGVVEVHPAPSTSTPLLQPLHSGPATVLLVEDEAPVRAFAARALRLKGYEVLEAESAEAALELLADARIAIDVFVTDVVMPGMDGPSWVRTALRDRPGTRVIFMSGYTEDIFGEGHSPVPNSTFLAKPFSLVELIDAVALHLQAATT